ncbi:MAG TPA: ABC transporter permease [Vicinamibacterales bacterium]|jgi:predicted permease|nr:ABC transporter permease [Vicinamibacterales bacterium]
MIRQDLRNAWRALVSRPSFSLMAALSLAIGIGANTAVFSLWNSVARAPLPGVADPGSLVMLTDPAASGSWHGAWATRTDGPRAWISYSEFEQFRDQAASFLSLMAAQSTLDTWQARVDHGQPEPLRGRLVSGSFFDVLGVVPAAGRLFTRDHDGVPRAEALVSHGFWQRRLGGRLDAIGHTVIVRDTPITIIGVTPAGFAGESGGQQPDLWLPLRMQPMVLPGADWLHEQPPDKVMWLQVFGRLRAGVTPAQAEAEANTLLERNLAAFYSTVAPERRAALLDQHVRIQSGARGVSSTLQQFFSSVSTLFAAVAILLSMACANLANLLLARGTARRGELAIRLSLGATRGQLLRQVFVESALLAAAGGVMAIGVAEALHEGLVRLLQASDPQLTVTFTTSVPVLLFTVVATAAAALASGVLPAWHLSRTDAGVHMAEARRGLTGSARDVRSGRWVVAAQLALALPLLVGAGLLVQTIINLRQPDLGFRSDGLLLARVNLGRLVQDTAGQNRALRALVARLSEIPDVERVSFSQLGLLSDGRSTAAFTVEGSLRPQERPSDGALDRVAPDYFATLGIPVIGGRDIESRDDAGAARVTVVNLAFASRFFGNGAAVGHRVVVGEPTGERTSYTIVGVAADAHTHALRGAAEPRFYVPAEQRPSAAATRTLLVRTRLALPALHARLLDVVAQVDPEISVTDVMSTPTRIARLTGEERALAQLATVFGIVAVALAALGLYGVLAFGVSRRTQEIAVRLALGAQSHRVVGMILSENLALVAAAIGAGSVLAVFASRLLRTQLYGIAADDPFTLAGAVSLMLMVATLAIYLPARRASRIEPMAALRQV